jgi:hypothetical protein
MMQEGNEKSKVLSLGTIRGLSSVLNPVVICQAEAWEASAEI